MMKSLLAEFKDILPSVKELVRWVAVQKYPDDQQEFISVSLRHPDEYPMNEGRIVSSTGLDIAIDDYQNHFNESHVAHSTALHSHLHGQPYLVGPLARLNLNVDRLPDAVQQLISEIGITFPSNNMFHSIIARTLEIYFAFLEAIDIMEDYVYPTASHMEYSARAGIGYGCTEAPRGILWHRYELDDHGNVVQATIIPPTSQNQARIEQDLRSSLLSFGLHHADAALRQRCETVIRNYDPCISCATHFLKLKVNHS
jgi:coenzyme F420-reducing hydrogenase alpha subunit